VFNPHHDYDTACTLKRLSACVWGKGVLQLCVWLSASAVTLSIAILYRVIAAAASHVQWCCPCAEPTAKKFTEGQLKPAADKVAANAKPTADKFNNEQLLPAADKIAQNAKPTADKLTEGQIKPAAQKIHDEAVPRTKDFTEGTLQPGAKRLADNAEPMADKLIKQGVEPLADVSTSHASCFCSSQPRYFCLDIITHSTLRSQAAAQVARQRTLITGSLSAIHGCSDNA